MLRHCVDVWLWSARVFLSVNSYAGSERLCESNEGRWSTARKSRLTSTPCPPPPLPDEPAPPPPDLQGMGDQGKAVSATGRSFIFVQPCDMSPRLSFPLSPSPPSLISLAYAPPSLSLSLSRSLSHIIREFTLCCHGCPPSVTLGHAVQRHATSVCGCMAVVRARVLECEQ